MIKIRPDLCIGCGHCVGGCAQQAISIVYGLARINQRLCNRCHLCLELCPHGAIVELAAVSGEKLTVMVGLLKQEANDIVERIVKLQQKRIDVKVE